MSYPSVTQLRAAVERLQLDADLKHERGAQGIAAQIAAAETAVREAAARIAALPDDVALAAREPDALDAIRALRPAGPRRMAERFDEQAYRHRLEGALLARMAGCTLGAIVESWQPAAMLDWAQRHGEPFPPTDYWQAATLPDAVRYGYSARKDYTRAGMHGVPVDDDIAYTLLGLLIIEQFGADFTTADVGKAWLKYLPVACTAEDIALKNLKAGIDAERAAEVDNPYVHWIGADIRGDPWGYLAPGAPERAATMAYRDACLSHRRSGVYGAMYFAAAISAALVLDDPIEALRIGLTEIPAECQLAADVQWALAAGPTIKDHAAARAAVDQRFAGMHRVHTNNNACLTIFGLFVGGGDVTRTLGQTVAMGLDNDCTAATAGSILGATVGCGAVPAHWHAPFDNTVHSYLIGQPRFAIDDLVDRFTRQALAAAGGRA